MAAVQWQRIIYLGLPTGSPTHGDSPNSVNRGDLEPRIFFSETPRVFLQYSNYQSRRWPWFPASKDNVQLSRQLNARSGWTP